MDDYDEFKRYLNVKFVYGKNSIDFRPCSLNDFKGARGDKLKELTETVT